MTYDEMTAPILVDTHCHLDHERMAVTPEDALAHAKNAGVAWMVSIGTSLASSDKLTEMVADLEQVYCSVGVHPEGTNKHQGEGDSVAKSLQQLAQRRDVVAIGETGLDYYYQNALPEAQEELFHAHCEVASDTNKALVVHSRDAERDTVRVLSQHLAKKKFPVIIHCFTGSQWLADATIEMGCMISMSGIVTFKSARDLQETAKTIPDGHLLIETDAPYLAPTPMRGKPNEPAYVRHTAEFLAHLRGQEFDHLADITTKNATQIFQVGHVK